MKDKTLSSEMLKALNGIRTIVTESGDVNIEFEKTMKEATDKIDSNLYSYIWLLSLAEKFEVIKVGGVASSSSTNNNSSLNVVRN